MKRKAVVSFVLVVLFLVSVFPLSTFSGAADSHGSLGLPGSESTDPTDWWPMFHHDLTHTGYSTSTALNTNNLLWTYPTGGVWGSPAVVGGLVYVGSLDGNVYCLNAGTGSLVWSYPTGFYVYSSPAVVGGLVYVGSNNHNVYCLNATTGAFVWNFTTGGIVQSSPAVVGGLVYVGSDDRKVYCLNATTGSLVWSYTTGGAVYYSSPAVVNGVVYVGSMDGKIYAFGDWWPMFHHDLSHTGTSTSTGPTTNNTLWTYPTGGQVQSSAAVVGGLVYVGSIDWNVYCLNAATGSLVWAYTTGGPVESSPAVVGSLVYVGSCDGYVYCLNAANGAFVWNYTTGYIVEKGNSVCSSPAVVGGLVYVGSGNGYVYCLNAATGSLVWNYATGWGVHSSPAVVGGLVYVGSIDGYVYCLNATTGSLVWSYPTGGGWSSPAVVGGLVYVGSGNGYVYCLNAATGTPVWNYTIDSYVYVYSSPAVVGGFVYVGSGNGYVYCLNATNGVFVWRYTTGSYVYSSPAVVGGLVYVGSDDHNVYCLNAATGTPVWNYTTGAYVESSPAVVNGIVYVGSFDGKIYAFGKQVNVHESYFQEPAPMGIVDYGIGSSGPYEYATKSFVGIVTLASLSTNGSFNDSSGVTNTEMSFQLNVNLAFNTSYGQYVYWIQDVAIIDTSSWCPGAPPNWVDFVDNVWNHTAPGANMSNSGISGNGTVVVNPKTGRQVYIYDCWNANPSLPGNNITLKYPATITFNVTSWVSSGDPTVSFAYDDGYGLITYDTVTFTNVTGLTSSSGFEVNGFSYDPRGGVYDAELILGGPCSRYNTTDIQSDVQLQLEYWNGHNYQIVTNAYNFGSETAEGIDNVLSGFSYYPGNGTIFAEILPGAGGQLGELYDQSQIGIINITSPLTSGTLYVTDASDPPATAWQIPFVGGEVTVTLYPGCYDLQLYNQYGQLFDQGNFTVSAGQTLYLQAPFSRGGGGGSRMPYMD